MQLHNTTQYAIRILSYLTKHGDDSVHYLLSAKEIAETLEIPYKFLTKIMGELTKAGFVTSIRGREGGYELKKPASEIKISNILDVFNDPLHEEQCILGIGFCDSTDKCALHDQWIQPKSLIEQMFKDTTLEQIAKKGTKV